MAMRTHVLERDDQQCRLCGGPAEQVDHVVPLHLGGADDVDNMQAICRSCHLWKTRAEGRKSRSGR